jgi:hypothetical protein
MGREGFLERAARAIGKVGRKESQSDDPDRPARRFEGRFGLYHIDLELEHWAKERLVKTGLSEDARAEVESLVRSARSVQQTEDEILWREAMLESGISPKKIDDVNRQRLRLEKINRTAYNGEPLPPEK